jgi:hypothetical protein
MFKSIFVYCPRSGSRLFAENIYGGRTTFALIEWGNKSVHLLSWVTEEQGSAPLNTVLAYSTACPNYHWRTTARAVATLLVKQFGGFAWDENGTVRLLLPRGKAGAAHRLMLAARSREVSSSGVFADEDAANEVALLLDGDGSFVWTERGQAQPTYAYGQSEHRRLDADYGYDYIVSAAVELNNSEDNGSEDNRKWVVTVRRTQVRRADNSRADNMEVGSEVLGTVMAPEAFGRPTLRGLNDAGWWVAD